jgi:hypothetical protein
LNQRLCCAANKDADDARRRNTPAANPWEAMRESFQRQVLQERVAMGRPGQHSPRLHWQESRLQ